MDRRYRTLAYTGSATACCLIAILAAASSCGSSGDTEPTGAITASSLTATPGTSASLSATPPLTIRYTVKPGDTLSQIADALGVSEAALRNANPGIAGDLIMPGDVLVIPAVSGPNATRDPSSTEPTSVIEDVTLLAVVDKQHSLPAGYVPPDLKIVPDEWSPPGFGAQQLRAEAVDALIEMLQTASDAGNEVRVRSSYRSYATQQVTFQYWIDGLGEAEARRVSAEPGHSEHQLGTAVDLTSADVGYDLVESFASTAGGEWLLSNSYRFGFALSYPDGKEDITGYAHEPWHFRFIGVDAATAWHSSGLTLIDGWDEWHLVKSPAPPTESRLRKMLGQQVPSRTRRGRVCSPSCQRGAGHRRGPVRRASGRVRKIVEVLKLTPCPKRSIEPAEPSIRRTEAPW